MKETKNWRCCKCQTIYGDKWNAENCCLPDVEEIIMYVCDDCSREYETKKEAFDCCNQCNLKKAEKGE